MKILAVDIGTGTQDILYLDTRLSPENAIKLVLPAPTLILRRKIREATRRGVPLALEGRMMGGGPNAWAAEAHVRSGQAVYITPEAARSFDDDANLVQEKMGLTLMAEDEMARLPPQVEHMVLGDFDIDPLRRALAESGVNLAPDLLALAAFDHGQAPPEISDRQFRFDYLDRRIRNCRRLACFAYPAQRVPPEMTRLQALAESGSGIAERVMVMDSAPAAVLGALLDPFASQALAPVVINIGNFHALCFRMRRSAEGEYDLEGLFEHHTGLVNRTQLEDLIRALADGRLTHELVYAAQGHGALVYSREAVQLGGSTSPLIVVGPRRGLMRGSDLAPYFAAPFGDMMLAGAFGLIRAAMEVFAELRAELETALADEGARAPWDVDVE
jgi:uncharacterized protein (DUF1786 family)